MTPHFQAEVKTMSMPKSCYRLTAVLFGTAVMLAACQGPGDRSAGDGKSVTKSYGYGTTCNGPCYGFHRRRGGMGPH